MQIAPLDDLGAEDEIRTRDIQLGRLTLYQLSYFRLFVGVIGFEPIQSKTTDLQSAPALQLRRTPILGHVVGVSEPVEGFEPPTR